MQSKWKDRMDTCGYLCIGVVCVCMGGVCGECREVDKLWVLMEMCINCGDGFTGVCICQNLSNCTL